MSVIWLDICFCILSLYLIQRLLATKSSFPLPPGPKGWPFIGNVFDLPFEKEWETFSRWADKWGDIVSISALGQRIVVVNSVRLAKDMMDKKGALYSDRPVLQMAGELVGWKNLLGFLPYGDQFRQVRKQFHQLLGTRTAMKQFFLAEEHETRRFLQRVLESPEQLVGHIRLTAGAIILRIAYGYEIKENDPFVKAAETAMAEMSEAVTSGKFLVDVFPILRYVPSWFPGASFKVKAKQWADDLRTMAQEPFDYVKAQLASGTAQPSFTSVFLEKNGMSTEDDANLKWAAAAMFAGGADTTVAAIHAFFLIMALYPDVQKRAQEELDNIVGKEKLPTFSDRDQLPYINAICKEILRYYSVACVALPHRVMDDDVHEGYLIPKGSIVIPNVWRMAHDPRTYKEPMTFNPDRFIASPGKEPELDPYELVFGFGRRICPGLLLADASIFIAVASTLAVFDITVLPEKGDVKPALIQGPGTVSHPIPFPCRITPRSAKASALTLGNN